MQKGETFDSPFPSVTSVHMYTSTENTCLTFDLPEGVHHLYVHGAVGQVGQILGVVARELVGVHDGVLLPVGPVEAALKGGDSKDVRHQEAAANDRAAPTAVDLGHADVVQVAVRPEDGAGHVVDGQSVGPRQVVLSVTHKGSES